MAGMTAQFNFPDENRDWMLSNVIRCPECGARPILKRRFKGKKFSVECDTKYCSKPYNTPFVDSSEKAVAAWRLVCALLKS